MDSQVAYPPADNVYENVPPHDGLKQEVEGQEDEQPQQGKKSVLKKVKAKAKKVKDTLVKHTGQSNGTGDQVPDDHDLDEEDDEDEEMAEDNHQPELHGAPIYESTEGRNPAVGETRSENRDGDGKREHPTQLLTPEILSDWTKVVGSNNEDRLEEEDDDLSQMNSRKPNDLEEDTQARIDPDHKQTHQFKVIDPSGQGSTEETEVTNLIRSFEKMNSESNQEPDLSKPDFSEDATDFQSGSKDQFSPESDLPTTAADRSMSPGKMETEDYPTNQSSYAQKVSEATSAITDRAISATNMVSSKLGYGKKDNETETPEENSASWGDNGNKFSAVTSAIADGAISCKNVVTSKLGYGQKDNERETIEENSTSSGEDGSKLSSAASAIKDKTIYTTNVVASKLGYGEKDNEAKIPEEKYASPGEEGNKFSAATSVIADKAISAKNMVASKLGYGEKDSESVTHENDGVKELAGDVYEKVSGAEMDQEPVGGENKGVSVKDYLSEKLKPGEEDKALSEVISGALYKNKDENENEPSETDHRAAKMTESEEVKQNVTEDGMVGMIKDTVGSWIGKSGPELQASPQSFGTSQGVEGFVDSRRPNEGEERRMLKESTN